MQVAPLRRKVRKYRCPFQRVYPGASFVQKGWNGREEGEGGGGESPMGKKSRPPRRVVEKFAFHPFHETSTSFHSSLYESIRITSDLSLLHRHRRPSFSLLCKLPRSENSRQAACRKVAVYIRVFDTTPFNIHSFY